MKNIKCDSPFVLAELNFAISFLFVLFGAFLAVYDGFCHDY